jgi:hypothetical protein
MLNLLLLCDEQSLCAQSAQDLSLVVIKFTLLYPLTRNNNYIDRSRKCVPSYSKNLSDAPLYQIAHNSALFKFCGNSHR